MLDWLVLLRYTGGEKFDINKCKMRTPECADSNIEKYRNLRFKDFKRYCKVCRQVFKRDMHNDDIRYLLEKTYKYLYISVMAILNDYKVFGDSLARELFLVNLKFDRDRSSLSEIINNHVYIEQNRRMYRDGDIVYNVTQCCGNHNHDIPYLWMLCDIVTTYAMLSIMVDENNHLIDIIDRDKAIYEGIGEHTNYFYTDKNCIGDYKVGKDTNDYRYFHSFSIYQLKMNTIIELLDSLVGFEVNGESGMSAVYTALIKLCNHIVSESVQRAYGYHGKDNLYGVIEKGHDIEDLGIESTFKLHCFSNWDTVDIRKYHSIYKNNVEYKNVESTLNRALALGLDGEILFKKDKQEFIKITDMLDRKIIYVSTGNISVLKNK